MKFVKLYSIKLISSQISVKFYTYQIRFQLIAVVYLSLKNHLNRDRGY